MPRVPFAFGRPGGARGGTDAGSTVKQPWVINHSLYYVKPDRSRRCKADALGAGLLTPPKPPTAGLQSLPPWLAA